MEALYVGVIYNTLLDWIVCVCVWGGGGSLIAAKISIFKVKPKYEIATRNSIWKFIKLWFKTKLGIDSLLYQTIIKIGILCKP